jgi:hypothetical protein
MRQLTKWWMEVYYRAIVVWWWRTNSTTSTTQEINVNGEVGRRRGGRKKDEKARGGELVESQQCQWPSEAAINSSDGSEHDEGRVGGQTLRSGPHFLSPPSVSSGSYGLGPARGFYHKEIKHGLIFPSFVIWQHS